MGGWEIRRLGHWDAGRCGWASGLVNHCTCGGLDNLIRNAIARTSSACRGTMILLYAMVIEAATADEDIGTDHPDISAVMMGISSS